MQKKRFLDRSNEREVVYYNKKQKISREFWYFYFLSNKLESFQNYLIFHTFLKEVKRVLHLRVVYLSLVLTFLGLFSYHKLSLDDAPLFIMMKLLQLYFAGNQNIKKVFSLSIKTGLKLFLSAN